MITSWSHSRIVDFEACKYRAWLKYDQKIPEPERELPEGKTEHELPIPPVAFGLTALGVLPARAGWGADF
jgi:hypothetical protein